MNQGNFLLLVLSSGIIMVGRISYRYVSVAVGRTYVKGPVAVVVRCARLLDIWLCLTLIHPFDIDNASDPYQ